MISRPDVSQRVEKLKALAATLPEHERNVALDAAADLETLQAWVERLLDREGRPSPTREVEG